jgi:hypothetical protein
MESIGKIVKFNRGKSSKPKVDPHLHSPAHLLADELSVKLNDKKHFGFYLKMATLYSHDFLRNLLGQVLESKEVKSPGKLFAYLIKKSNLEKSESLNPKSETNSNI